MDHLSPKEFALAIGVSESSVKRWVDQELISVTRTVGGHRRIGRADAVEFARRKRMVIKRPDLLGLGVVERVREGRNLPRLTGSDLMDALSESSGDHVVGLLTNEFLDGRSIAQLCDGPISHALARLGEQWMRDQHGIYREHRALQMCATAITTIQELLPRNEAGEMIAVGGAVPGDPYMLPTMMVAAVLREHGFNAVNLGPTTPASAMMSALESLKPTLIWYSCTAYIDPEDARSDLQRVLGRLEGTEIKMALGGREAGSLSLEDHPQLVRLQSMSELAEFVKQD